MPIEIEHEGKKISVYTEDEVTQKVDTEVRGLKITNSQLKEEKEALSEKLSEAKSASQDFEIKLAEANGDKEKAQRLADEVKADKEREHSELLNTIKTKEINLTINELVTKHGSGGSKNEDLQDLIKSRYQFDYDIKTGQVSVSGSDVSSIADLTKLIQEGDRYAAYRPGSGASGTGAAGSKGAGVATKKFTEYNSSELLAIKRENPAEYQRLVAEHKQTA